MKNEVEKSVQPLMTSAETAANGAEQLGNQIGLLQNTSVAIRADLSTLQTADNAYDAAKVELTNRRIAVRSTISASRAVLMLARDNFKPKLGNEYSEAWDVTGLVGSLAMPRTYDEVPGLLRKFKAFLVANPEQEVAPKNITAERFDSQLTDLNAVRASASEQELVVDTAFSLRTEKTNALRKRMRGLIGELDMLLEPLDPRWKRFGLNMPGAEETPDAPQGVSVTLIGPTAAAVKWGAAPRAEYYRVWKKVNGVDEEPVAVGSPADLDFTIENLPVNATIEVAVSAVNNGGESELSQSVTITTH